MLKSLLLLVCCVMAVWSSAPRVVRTRRYDLRRADQLFEDFVRTHHRVYQSEEERQMRFKIFKGNLKSINKRNMKSKTATFGINRFTDMAIDEAVHRFTGLKQVNDNVVCPPAPMVVDPAPESFDWRDHNKVTKVKDQLRCGSCWAFSAVGNVEGQYAILHNELKDFSEQQLVDCDSKDDGCFGGYMSNAFKWIKDHGGIEAEEDYPYIARHQKCRFVKDKVEATVAGCQKINGTDEHKLKQYLVSTGPLAIAVNADDLIAYQSGILDSCKGGVTDHGVLLVGYGTENNIPYWIIKNSWGEDYGEKGYVRVKMYVNACNLTSDVMSAIVN